MQLQGHLDQACHPGRRIQMPDVGFHRPNPAGPHRIRRLAEGLAQRRDLNRIAQIGARAVTFDIAHALGIHPRHSLRLGNATRLPIHRRRQIPGLRRAVVVDG